MVAFHLLQRLQVLKKKKVLLGGQLQKSDWVFTIGAVRAERSTQEEEEEERREEHPVWTKRKVSTARQQSVQPHLLGFLFFEGVVVCARVCVCASARRRAKWQELSKY